MKPIVRQICQTVIIAAIIACPFVGVMLLIKQSKRMGQAERLSVTISPEITHILQPINPDGTVNYVAHLDIITSQGVTAGNNAAAGLIEAGGPGMLPPAVDEITREALGIKASSADGYGKYFMPLGQYARQAGLPLLNIKAERKEAMSRLWPTGRHDDLAKWLELNEKSLAKIVAATALPRFYLPHLASGNPPTMKGTPLPSFARFQEMAQALATRAMLRLGEGDAAGACADALACHRLARLIGQMPFVLGHWMSIRIEKIACEADIAIAVSGRLGFEQAKAHLGQLQDLEFLRDLAEIADQYHRFALLDSITTLGRAGAKRIWKDLRQAENQAVAEVFQEFAPPKQLDWDIMLSKCNRWCDDLAAGLATESYAERKSLVEQSLAAAKGFALSGGDGRDDWRTRINQAKKAGQVEYRQALSEAVLDVAISAHSRPWENAVQSQDSARMQLELARLATALAAYRAQRSAQPVKLTVLAPKYIERIPTDVFTGKPLRYSPASKGYLLYSVGPNMTDGGGDDIAVRADFSAKGPKSAPAREND